MKIEFQQTKKQDASSKSLIRIFNSSEVRLYIVQGKADQEHMAASFDKTKTFKHMYSRIVNENVCTNKKDVKNMVINLYLPANGGFNPPFAGK